MKKVFLVFALLCFICEGLFSQLENHTWYYGNTNKGLFFDFVTNNVSIVTGHYAPMGLDGNSTAANPHTGDEMFYTDGKLVIDKTNNVMPNGSGLISGHPFQNAIICPNPGNCNQYYVFHFEELTNHYLYYSMVDMSLPGNGTVTTPLGDVVPTLKNIQFCTNISEAGAVVPGINHHKSWLLVPIMYTDQIEVFSVTSSGITLVNTYNTGTNMNFQCGLRYCPVNNKLALGSDIENESVILMDFNRTTGILSNFTNIPGTPFGSSSGYFGVVDEEWSADGTKLYISKYRDSSPVTGGKLYQYDLNLPANPPQLIYSVPSLGLGLGLKRGPDNKIYYNYINPTYSDNRILGVVNNPNSAGAACNFVSNGLTMSSSHSDNKFPEFIFYNNQKPVAIIDTASITINCNQTSDTVFVFPLSNDTDADGDSLDVTIINTSTGSAIVLPNHSVEYIYSGSATSAVITYVTCDDQCFNLCDTSQINITIHQTGGIPPVANAGPDVAICIGSSATLNASGGTSYQWSPATGLSCTNCPSPIANPSSTTNYIVTVYNGTCFDSDTVVVSVYNPPNPLISGDTLICSGNPTTLTASGGTFYLWSTTAITPSITVSPVSGTTYTVTVSNAACSSSASITVNTVPSPIAIAEHDTTIDAGGNVQLHGSGGGSYYWYPSTGLSCTNCPDPVANPTGTTMYILVVSDSNGCADADTVLIIVRGIDCGDLYVPNAFSPNGDEVNDVLYVRGNCIVNLAFYIYDRWGEKVFETHDPAVGWDGKYHHKLMDTDVFDYFLNATLINGDIINRKGNITLFR